MEITRIKVEELYGLHNYDIPFNTDENIKIIHAPNGYGKTTLLKLISDIIQCRLFEISVIPFKSFRIEFDDQTVIQVVKETKDEKTDVYYHIGKEKEFKTYQLSQQLSSNKLLESKLPIDYIEQQLPYLRKMAQAGWYDTKRNERGSAQEVMEGYEEGLFIDAKLRTLLGDIRKMMPVHFIHANRLVDSMDMGEGRVAGRRRSALPAVMVYAKELADCIDKTLAKSAELAQELDRTFPARLIEEMSSQSHEQLIQMEMINQQLDILEKRRIKLEAVGLLTAGAFEQKPSLSQIDQQTLKVLKLYVDDSMLKLDVFNEIETKMNLMKEIINKRFNYKVMQFNREKGFEFELPNKNRLSPDKLSSGEQNELILIFELLFKSCSNSLILIDEPEISLHIAWQQQFLEDMQAISDLTDVKIIIATHSPDIISGRWDLTTGLEEC